MLNTRRILLWVIPVFVTAASLAAAERTKDIPLRDVPRHVIHAARNAAPGITLFEAEIRRTTSGTIYELEGFDNEYTYEMNIHENGTVLLAIKALRGVIHDDAESAETSHD